MVKVRTLAPLTHPTTGEHFAAEIEVDVADDVAAEWRADGKVALVDVPAPPEGVYDAVTTREDNGGNSKKGKA